MLTELLFILASATSVNQVVPQTAPAPAQVEAPQADIGAVLVQRLVAICGSHSEVERAFLLSQSGPEGTTYMFVPIFDRKVSDEALNEAVKAYKEINPGAPGLQMMLLKRNTWKNKLRDVPPIYVRPKQ